MSTRAAPATLEIPVPFDGFYETLHNQTLDLALESINTDDRGEAFERLSGANVNWQPVMLAYAQRYLAELADLVPLRMSFSRLASPKFYNFDNDQIFANIPVDDIEELRRSVAASPDSEEAFRQHVQEVLQPRSGFIPFYPNRLSEWGPLEEWSEAQISVLVDFAAKEAGLDQALIAKNLREKTESLIWEAVIDPSQIREPEPDLSGPAP